MDPTIVAQAYWFLTGKIAYLMLFFLLMGTIRHRERLAHGWVPRGRGGERSHRH